MAWNVSAPLTFFLYVAVYGCAVTEWITADKLERVGLLPRRSPRPTFRLVFAHAGILGFIVAPIFFKARP